MDHSVKSITSKEIDGELNSRYGKTAESSTVEQMYFVLSALVMNRLTGMYKKNNTGGKTVHYLSMEFLPGRNLAFDSMCLGLTESIEASLRESGFGKSFAEICRFERDPGLGSGGLGRLAASFLSSLTSLGYPARGYSLLYENGYFAQKIVEGEQLEQPDDWLKTGEVWLLPSHDEKTVVRMGGRVSEDWSGGKCRITNEGTDEITAVPYDLLFPGFRSGFVNPLRLWKAERTGKNGGPESKYEEWGGSFVNKSLYPSDDRAEGKLLRLTQQYFLVSATIKDIVRSHLEKYGSLSSFPVYQSIHINDTHPSLAVPELLRILLDDHGFGWNEAWEIVRNTVSYTNHTVMPEALETWNEDLLKLRLPRIHGIIKEINERYCRLLWNFYPGNFDLISKMAVISHSRIRMATLSAVASKKVNGVSRLHSEILKSEIFSNEYSIDKNKFTGITNGVSHLRWLNLANPSLTSLIKSAIGDRYEKEPEALAGLLKFKDDASFLQKLSDVKKINKRRIIEICFEENGTVFDENGIVDVQIKRFHEYKRQLMNALKILYLYGRIKNDPSLDVPPLIFIFGGKAAPGYLAAKSVIRLIWNIGLLISSDPVTRERMKVILAEDYSVSSAEIMIPGADVSEQISLAGKEASGTGCMKLMMNGAILLGTPDGANPEIKDAVGDENAYIFGSDKNRVEEVRREGYRPMKYYIESERVRESVDLLDAINDRTLSDEIKKYLLYSDGTPDPFMCLLDLDPYLGTYERILKDYCDGESWARKSLFNIAESGHFSSYRSVREYSEDIWGIRKQNTGSMSIN